MVWEGQKGRLPGGGDFSAAVRRMEEEAGKAWAWSEAGREVKWPLKSSRGNKWWPELRQM